MLGMSSLEWDTVKKQFIVKVQKTLKEHEPVFVTRPTDSGLQASPMSLSGGVSLGTLCSLLRGL